MDFDFSEDQRELRELAARIFADLADHASQRRVEMSATADETIDPRFDRRLWSALAEAGILGLAIGEEHGGAGLGFLEACIAVEEAGRAAAPVPLTTATVLGALPLQRFGSDETRKTWLARLSAGEVLVSAALGSVVGDPLRPGATASRTGSGGWRLRGSLSNVACGMVADAVVTAAVADEGTGLFLVEPDAHGLPRHRQQATDGRIEARIELDGLELGDRHVLVAPGEGGGEAHRWCIERAQTGLCVEIAGACRAALELTARYTAERVQFDKPIATFQAVGQRAA
ncbi:MAG TPA: acyl-CoA dehydrogenase family protein, partial [Acidimicrobiales bacterium]|nr:acyl-CoA dehydrogenase family protein [Acidimicrobiales bacterium]